MSTSIIVTGSKGRMGTTLLNCAKQDPDLKVVGAVDVGDSVDAWIQPGSVIIDFSHHTATPGFLKAACQHQGAVVIGTTGFTDSEKAAIHEAVKTIPVLWSTNMSLGVNLLFSLTKTVGNVLPKGFDIEIIEKHHRHKKDAPSGTATTLLEIASETRQGTPEELARHGRQGDTGERTDREIGVHAVRGGDYVGEHTVIFAGQGEVIEITHKASSREIFARGALHAAKWLSTARPGLYTMLDILGLK